jgi:hypothetical protein
MARRRLLTGFALAAGSLAGTILFRRRGRRRRDRIDLYYEDGSMVSLAEASPEAAALLPAARQVLAAGRR